MNMPWKKLRLWLLGALVLCFFTLFGIYVMEALDRYHQKHPSEAAQAALASPEDAEEAEKLMMKEVEAGRANRDPGTFGFVFRGDVADDPCSWRCLDSAVAAGLDVHLYSSDGRHCKTRTLDAVLWKSEALSLPATPLEKKAECGDAGEFEIAIFGIEHPHFEWIDMRKAASKDPKDIAAFNKDQKLHDRLIEGSSKAEGTLVLPDSILPLPPMIAKIDTPEGSVTLSTLRWTEKSESGGFEDPRTGPTDFALAGAAPKVIADNGLFCSEVPYAFKLEGSIYLFEREWGCDSGLSCRAVLRWEKDHFQMSYGNCNFST